MDKKSLIDRLRVLGKSYFELEIQGEKSVFVFDNMFRSEYIKGDDCIAVLGENTGTIYKYKIMEDRIEKEDTGAEEIMYYTDKKIILLCTDELLFKGLYIREDGYRFISEEDVYSKIGYKGEMFVVFGNDGAVFNIGVNSLNREQYLITYSGKFYKVGNAGFVYSGSGGGFVMSKYNDEIDVLKDTSVVIEVGLCMDKEGCIELDRVVDNKVEKYFEYIGDL